MKQHDTTETREILAAGKEALDVERAEFDDVTKKVSNSAVLIGASMITGYAFAGAVATHHLAAKLDVKGAGNVAATAVGGMVGAVAGGLTASYALLEQAALPFNLIRQGAIYDAMVSEISAKDQTQTWEEWVDSPREAAAISR